MTSLFSLTRRVVTTTAAPGKVNFPGPSRAAVEWAAQQTSRMHREPPSAVRATGRCAQCPPDPAGCPHLAWATAVLHANHDPPTRHRG